MMIAIVEFALKPGMEDRFSAALNTAHELLKNHEGFLGEEPCRSIADENRFVSVFYFRDRQAIDEWRRDAGHKQLQQAGKNEIFAWYRIHIAELERQYGHNVPDELASVRMGN